MIVDEVIEGREINLKIPELEIEGVYKIVGIFNEK